MKPDVPTLTPPGQPILGEGFGCGSMDGSLPHRQPPPAATPITTVLFTPACRIGDLILSYPEIGSTCDRLGLGAERHPSDPIPERVLLLCARAAQPPPPEPDWDWSYAEIPELVDHLVMAHHRKIRNELQRLGILVRYLALRHDDSPHLKLNHAFMQLADHLAAQLDYEEIAIFPLCIAIESERRGRGRCHHPPQDVTTRIRAMLIGHQEVEAELAQMLARVESAMDLTEDEDLPVIRCGLAAMMADLSLHSAKEQGILVPATLFAEEQVQVRRLRNGTTG